MKMIRESYPDLLLILSKDIIVSDILYNSRYQDLLLDINHIQLNLPIEFLIHPKLAAIIRFKIENTEVNEQLPSFNYLFSKQITYEVRIHKDHENSESNYTCLIRDISGFIESRDDLKYMAYHDSLTGLPNRSHYYETLNKTIDKCHENNQSCGVIFFDLDRFKAINDSLGHRIGDELLVAISKRLTYNLKSNEFIARISGDEFIVIVSGIYDESEIIETANRILSLFKTEFQLKNHIIDVKSSIGVSIFPTHSDDADILTQFADTAMYKAKDFGGNQIIIFNKEQNSLVKRNFTIDQGLRRAIKNNEIYMVYQPQYCIKTNNITGLEALARWRLQDGSMISPEYFIEVAELTGYINELGLWIINSVCTLIKTWKQSKVDFKKISINLSRKQLIDPDLVQSIFSIMKFHGVNSSDIVFEITEDSIIQNRDLALKNLYDLHNVGIQIAIDDFGSGYSSFVDLKKFPFSELKIDKSIIDDIGKNKDNDAIIRSIITLGLDLGLNIVAEGVESKQQFEFLSHNKCPIIQGYYVAKPLSNIEIVNILDSSDDMLLSK